MEEHSARSQAPQRHRTDLVAGRLIAVLDYAVTGRYIMQQEVTIGVYDARTQGLGYDERPAQNRSSGWGCGETSCMTD